MSPLDGLSADELAAAEAAVARMRAEQDVVAAGGDLGGPDPQLAIERPLDVPAPEPERVDPLDALVAAQEAAEAEDFGAFWSSRTRKGKTLRNVVPGVDVHLPASLPLAFEVESRRLMNDQSMGAVHRLFGLLYGAGTLDALIEGGLDGEQLSVLLLWGSMNGNGRPMTLAEATDEFERLQAAQAQGKAPAPLAVSGATSSGIGRSSKRTSPASTRSKAAKKR